ncbi:MAG: SIS domain-containing protein [Patescibacteria group bacterium]
MEEAIKNFPQQFEFVPEVVNETNLKKSDKFIICGMGASHLGASILKRENPTLDLLIHRDYGLPRVPEYFLKNALIILSSYSGDTEEVLDVAKLGKEKGLTLAIVATDGKLLEFARDNNIPFIKFPDTKIEPRMALGFSMIALARLMQDSNLEEKIKFSGNRIDPQDSREVGEDLATVLRDKIPLVYSSTLNLPLAYIWKIKFNETGKIPAFYNCFPELNHNEISGFDMHDNTEELSEKFNPIFLTDDEDDERIKKRMDIMEQLFLDRSINVTRIPLEGDNTFTKIFRSALLAEWTALNLANYYGEPDAETPLISEFKKKMGQ